MRNKFLYILIGVLVNFSFMMNVFAEDAFEYTIDATTDSTDVVVGSEVSINISLKSNAAIDACLFKINLDDNIEFVSPTDLNGWRVDKNGIGENGILVESGSFTVGGQLSDGVNIVSLKYKIKGNGSLKITSESYCSDGENDVYAKEKVINFTTRELSEDNTLKSIKINGVDIPNFSSDGNSYPVEIEEPKFSLSWETTNPDFQDKVVVKMNDEVITQFDNINWSDPTGQSIGKLELIVNEKKTYSIAVMYEKKDLDNTLKSLKINGEMLNLKSGETRYSIKVGKDITNVKIEAELNDKENFKLDDTFVNGIKTHSFSGSSTSFTIEIIPISDQVGASSLSYIIEVVREGSGSAPPSSSKPSSSKPATGDVEKNPQTGDISMFVMALILISSLIGSVILYQKNIEAYK